MKILLLFLTAFLCFGSIDSYTQKKLSYQPLDCIMRTDTTTYPFFESLKASRVKHSLPPLLPEYWGNLPVYTYEDIGELKKRNDPKLMGYFLRRFVPTNGRYHLISCRFFAECADYQRGLLITFDTLGNVIDNIEAEIYFPGCYIRHWGIDSLMQVTTYHLKLQTPKPTLYYGNFESFPGQRVDTRYQIDSLGRFHYVGETRYEPRNYTKEYLNTDLRCIWEGTERPLRASDTVRPGQVPR